VTDDVEAQAAPRLDDAPVRCELDEICGLVLVEVVRADEAQPHRCRDHAFLEVLRVELEPVAQELDDEVVARAVVGREHRSQRI
jgi:hypothetical protein